MKEENISVIHIDESRVLYEKGWWMSRDNWDTLNLSRNRSWYKSEIPYGIDRNERTKELTLFIIPK